jgi:chemotaxis protein CheZ
MAGPRNVFRIEQTAGLCAERDETAQPPHLAQIMAELTALRARLADTSARPPGELATPRHPEIDRLASDLRRVHAAIIGSDTVADGGSAMPTRAISELEAATAVSEQAAQKILAAAEDIDQAANTLSAALKSDSERDLAQDIRDRVIQIFEACNYQDLASQRVAKVAKTLHRIERHIAHVLNEPARDDTVPPAHGPRLPNDRGHFSQSDIDALFAGKKKSA